MQTDTQSAPVSRALVWTGWIMSVLPALLLLFAGLVNVLQLPFAAEGAVKMGYSESVILPLGIALLASTILYLIPPTAGIGAILLTGYLGGAVDAHVRQGDGLFIVPVLFAAVLWVGLILRDARLRALLPLRK